MSNIQRKMRRAWVREGFKHKNVAKEKERTDARNRAIEEQRRRILEYTNSLPLAAPVAEEIETLN